MKDCPQCGGRGSITHKGNYETCKTCDGEGGIEEEEE